MSLRYGITKFIDVHLLYFHEYDWVSKSFNDYFDITLFLWTLALGNWCHA